MEHRVVTDVLDHLDRPDINPAGDLLDDLIADKPDLILSEEETRDDGRSLQRVAGDHLLELIKQRVGKHGGEKRKLENRNSKLENRNWKTIPSRGHKQGRRAQNPKSRIQNLKSKILRMPSESSFSVTRQGP